MEKTIKIKKGLDLPIQGSPVQEIFNGPEIKRVALSGPDYHGMKPSFAVKEGDKVRTGQLLFTDKKMPKVRYTAPGTGAVTEINRGEKRRFLSIVIELEKENPISFKSYRAKRIAALKREQISDQLLASGLWTSLRERPFEKTANPDHDPHALFITAMDTHPLAPRMDKIHAGQEENLQTGLILLSKLIEGTVYFCHAPDFHIELPDLPNIHAVSFKGPHPAGNAGTHIHFLDPVKQGKVVWHIGLQDVMAIGRFFLSGALGTQRIISLAGPGVKNPGLLHTRLGASVNDLTAGQLTLSKQRVISGSVLSGSIAEGALGFLGRYHQQISVVPEYQDIGFFSWLNPGLDRFSLKRIVASRFLPKIKINFNTALHGGGRSIVPVGNYEKVTPLDILPTYLLRSLCVDDIDQAEKLGCLELAEEDLSLCTLVCPSKIDHAANLRQNLTLIEKEGL